MHLQKSKYQIKALLFLIVMALLGLFIRACRPLQYYLYPSLLECKSLKTPKAKQKKILADSNKLPVSKDPNFFQNIGFGKSPKESFIMKEVEVKKIK